MTSQHSDKSSSNSLPYEPGSLPPRSEKHGRKKANETTEELFLQEEDKVEENEANQNELEQVGEGDLLEIKKSHLESKQQQVHDQEELLEEQEQHNSTGEELDDEVEDNYKRPKSGFPLIQIILFSFLSIIAAIIVIWGWNYYQDSKADNTYVDPLDGLFRDPEEEQQEPPNEVPSEEEDQNEGANEDIENPQAGLEEPEQPVDSEDSNQHVDSEDSNQAEEPNLDNNQDSNEGDTQEPAIIAVHTVQPGDTFFSITMKYYESSQYRDYLAEYNQIEDQSTIYVGMQIDIPEKP